MNLNLVEHVTSSLVDEEEPTAIFYYLQQNYMGTQEWRQKTRSKFGFVHVCCLQRDSINFAALTVLNILRISKHTIIPL